MLPFVSRTHPLESQVFLDPRCISLDTEEDVPVLRVWDPEAAIARGEVAPLAVGEGALIEQRVEQAWGKPPGWLRTLSPEDREVMVRIALAARKEDR